MSWARRQKQHAWSSTRSAVRKDQCQILLVDIAHGNSPSRIYSTSINATWSKDSSERSWQHNTFNDKQLEPGSAAYEVCLLDALILRMLILPRNLCRAQQPQFLLCGKTALILL